MLTDSRFAGAVPGSPLLRVSFLCSRGAQRGYLTAALLFPAIIAIACWFDGTWTMLGSGKGFSQHYGFWVIFITTPTIVLLTSYLRGKFVALIWEIDAYCCANITEDMRGRVGRLVERHIRSLSLHSRSSWIFVFFMIVFFCWWLVNIIKTISPVDTYQHDVFDGYAHSFGFYTAKIYIGLVFVFVYSAAAFVALHVTASMISVLKFLCQHKILHVNFFHVDNCGGTSQFGNINLIILAIYANFFAIIYAMYITHRQTYLVMTVSLTACSLLAIVQSVIAVYYIHSAVAQEKRESIETVALLLNEQTETSYRGGRFPNDLLAFRNHLMSVHTFPYAAKALIAVNIVRFAPVAIAVFGYFDRS